MPSPKSPRRGGLEDLIGREIAGRYRVVRLIAKGGMGAVYEAEQIPLGRKVAVKILQPPPNVSDAASFEQRFFLEASTLARLNHPHTVTLHDYGQTKDGIYYLVMEFVEGRTLSGLLRDEGPLPAERTLTLMMQVSRALRNAHRMGVVHRDLKPSNLLIQADPDGEEHLKVVDFGLVKLTDGDQSITVTGVIMGSPHCMAPEQVQGLDVDERTDIYALGILIFRCVAGQYPFHGATTTATMIAHINDPVPRISQVAPDAILPPGLDDVVFRCMQKDPEDRWPDMSAFIRALHGLTDLPLSDDTTTTTLSSVQDGEPVDERDKRVVLVLAVFALVLILIGAGLSLRRFASQDGVVEGPPATEPVAIPDPAVTIATDPVGAEVVADGQVIGITPFEQILGDQAPLRVELRHEGYEPRVVELPESGGELIVVLTEASPKQGASPDEGAAEPEPVVERPVDRPPERQVEKPRTQEPASSADEGSGEAGEGPETPEGYKDNPFR